MRAAVYERCGPPHAVLSIADVPDPAPGPGEVLIAVDTKKRAGWLTSTLPAPRVIPHSDAAGTIVAVGAGVPARRIGERVWAMRCDAPYPGAGGAAEFAVVAAEHTVPLPDHVAFEIGACLGVPAMTAHAAVFGDGPVTGRTVLVTGGAGAVAAYAIQFAVWNGARVIATASTPEKQAIARENGAEIVIDYRAGEAATIAAILDATGGRGVDRIVEVDFGANLAVCHGVLAPNGVVAAYSSSRVREPVLPYYAFAMKGAAVRFVQGMLLTRDEREAGARTITALLARAALRHRIAASFPLDRIADAHAAAEAGTIGKVITASFTPDGDTNKR
jgi:NADPH:quinone reductase